MFWKNCVPVIVVIVLCQMMLHVTCLSTLPMSRRSGTSHSRVCLAASAGDNDSVTNPQKELSRMAFLAKSATSALTFMTILSPQSAMAAKEVDESLKGTKQDPTYEACVSKCMYECTKPKGMEQKSRKECLPGCKQECATTKQQLMLGTPINKE